MGEFDQHEGEAQTIVNLAEAAMHMYRAAIDSLPFPEDKKFQKRAEVVLTGMRKLRAALTEAASHSRPTPTVMMALSDVRRRYDDLMERAADAPDRLWDNSFTTPASTPSCRRTRRPTGSGFGASCPMSSKRAGRPPPRRRRWSSS